jgi:hypothetical protein
MLERDTAQSKSRVESSMSGPQPGHTTSTTSADALTETSTNGTPAEADPFGMLTKTDLAEVRANFDKLTKYPGKITFEEAYAGFVRFHKNKDTPKNKITKSYPIGWCKKEKPHKDKPECQNPGTTESPKSDTRFMRDMPRFYPDDVESVAAMDWFIALKGFTQDQIESDEASELFDETVDAAIKAADVVIVESAQGKCTVGLNRQPVVTSKKVNQLKGKNKNEQMGFWLSKPFIGERQITNDEISKIRELIRAMPESQAVAVLVEVFPGVDTNWQAVLDEPWLFDRDASGLYSGKS